MRSDKIRKKMEETTKTASELLAQIKKACFKGVNLAKASGSCSNSYGIGTTCAMTTIQLSTNAKP